MKKLLLVLILLVTAGSVFAAELKVTGDMTVRGTTDSYTPDGGDKDADSFFDYDLNLNLALVANENATVFTKLTFDKNLENTVAANPANQVSGETAFGDGKATTGDAVLEVERAYLNYKFAPFAQLNTGLMGGGQWATAFGDREVNVMRVQAIGALSADMIFIATYEKNKEGGYTVDPKDNEKTDNTTYYLSSKMKFGAITLLPLFAYGTIGTYETMGYSVSKMGATLGVNGDFGMIGLESEFAYGEIDYDGMVADDYAAYGAYVNIFAKIDAAKVGVAVAYGSSDDKKGSFEFGDDFDFTIVADDLAIGSVASAIGGNAGLRGMTVGKLYADMTMDKLTFGGAFAYGQATDKKVLKYYMVGATPTAIGSDISFWEVDVTASYAFDANASYSVAFGYASLEDGDASETDTQYRLQHAFAVKF